MAGKRYSKTALRRGRTPGASRPTQGRETGPAEQDLLLSVDHEPGGASPEATPAPGPAEPAAPRKRPSAS